MSTKKNDILFTPTYLQCIIRYLTIPEICFSLLPIYMDFNQIILGNECFSAIIQCLSHHFGESYSNLGVKKKHLSSKQIIRMFFKNYFREIQDLCCPAPISKHSPYAEWETHSSVYTIKLHSVFLCFLRSFANLTKGCDFVFRVRSVQR